MGLGKAADGTVILQLVEEEQKRLEQRQCEAEPEPAEEPEPSQSRSRRRRVPGVSRVGAGNAGNGKAAVDDVTDVPEADKELRAKQ